MQTSSFQELLKPSKQETVLMLLNAAIDTNNNGYLAQHGEQVKDTFGTPIHVEEVAFVISLDALGWSVNDEGEVITDSGEPVDNYSNHSRGRVLVPRPNGEIEVIDRGRDRQIVVPIESPMDKAIVREGFPEVTGYVRNELRPHREND